MIGHVFLTVTKSRMTLLQTLVTEKQPQLTFGSRWMNTWQNDQYLKSLTHLMSLYYIKRRPNHNLMYTVDPLLVTVVKNSCTKSSAHAHGAEIRGVNVKLLETSMELMQGYGRFSTDLQGRIWTSDDDSRTGTFHQTRVTAVDTACSVNGVLL